MSKGVASSKPFCKHCGSNHWLREPHVYMPGYGPRGDDKLEKASAMIKKGWQQKKVAEKKLASPKECEACNNKAFIIEQLRAEIGELKHPPTKDQDADKKRRLARERKRKYRAKQKENA